MSLVHGPCIPAIPYIYNLSIASGRIMSLNSVITPLAGSSNMLQRISVTFFLHHVILHWHWLFSLTFGGWSIAHNFLAVARGSLLYFAICYFAPAYSGFEPLSVLQYLSLYDIITFASIWGFSTVRDFSAWSYDGKLTFSHKGGHVWRSYDIRSWSKAASSSMSKVTDYGNKFLALGSPHGFVIYCGLSQWPRSAALTCGHLRV